MENLIETAKKEAVSAMEWFLRNLSHVPREKLDWAPSQTSKSALQIAAHTAVTAGNFAKMIRARKLPTGDEIPEFIEHTAVAEESLTDIDDIIALLRKNTDEVLSALDTLSPEDTELVLDSSQGWTMPMTFLMKLPAYHGVGHTAQIDFLQTCWGDQEIYVG
jgi:hypothetical protein